MNLTAIVATDASLGIGIDNRLPWPHNKDDMQWFIRKTSGKTVIMGSKTWESLPNKPLPKRKNVVITRSDNLYGDHTVQVKPNDSLLAKLYDFDCDGAIVIGGAQIYAELWPFITKLHWTQSKIEYDCDTYLDIPHLMSTSNGSWALEEESQIGDLNFSTWNLE